MLRGHGEARDGRWEAREERKKLEVNRFFIISGMVDWWVIFAPKATESQGRGAFTFTLGQKLLLAKSNYGVFAFWLVFGFCKNKSRLESPTKDTLSLLLSRCNYSFFR